MTIAARDFARGDEMIEQEWRLPPLAHCDIWLHRQDRSLSEEGGHQEGLTKRPRLMNTRPSSFLASVRYLESIPLGWDHERGSRLVVRDAALPRSSP